MIVIIDYGMGNLGSIHNMLKKIGVKSIITGNLDEIRQAEKLILPGVGAFDHGMLNLAERRLIPLLNERVLDRKVPILGLCLGMQLFTKCSEEGQLSGLGWVNAETIAFKLNGDVKFRIPHMGWNFVSIKKKNVLSDDKNELPRFYFVHSYHVVCHDQSDVIGITEYGYPFVSIFQHENIFGTQFHPEKSHKFGMRLLKQFTEGS
jgi:imidazole glycerol-phosphate synthase subunit HisH